MCVGGGGGCIIPVLTCVSVGRFVWVSEPHPFALVLLLLHLSVCLSVLLPQAVVTQQAKLKRHKAKSDAIGGQPHPQALSKTNVERLEVAGRGLK